MTRCAACPCPPDVACLGPTSHPQFCEWAATGGDTVHVVNRSRIAAGLPPGAPEPRPAPLMPPLMAMAVDCLYRDPGCASCRGIRCWANRGDREHGRATSLANCERCCGQLVPFRRD